MPPRTTRAPIPMPEARFEKFPEFPQELQDIIWTHACNEQRFVVIYERQDSVQVRLIQIKVRGQHFIPPALQVSRTAREKALEIYSLCQEKTVRLLRDEQASTETNRVPDRIRCVYVNFNVDRFLFAGYHLRHGNRALPITHFNLQSKHMKRFRYAAILPDAHSFIYLDAKISKISGLLESGGIQNITEASLIRQRLYPRGIEDREELMRLTMKARFEWRSIRHGRVFANMPAIWDWDTSIHHVPITASPWWEWIFSIILPVPQY